MSLFKCKICGGTLAINSGETVATCEYCGTKQTLPKLDNEKKANLFDRANHFRRNNDFDKAMSIYEQILNEDTDDAESYWSIVLCRYGIEYVEDPSSRKRIPTVNRAQFTSVFDDEDYKSAIKYADANQKELYEAEAGVINEIQKGILSISQKEEPFDVFICYKETDANGRRTQDSVLATELYHELTREGYKVFFSRISLEDKLGQEYEPYIFAALNSSKVMVVLGTRPEYFNAVWVKNEWSRYLSLIKNGAKKMLIPAFKDMDPYDLPEEFSHLQAQDMSKLGFMQDLIRGIKKIIDIDEQKQTIVHKNVITSGNVTNIEPLLERVLMFLEDGDWQSADEYCEKILDIDPKNARAYVGKLMAELRINRQTDLVNCAEPFDTNKNFQKAIRFADDNFAIILKNYISSIIDRNNKLVEEKQKESLYNKANNYYATNSISNLENAVSIFKDLLGWKDSNEKLKLCYAKLEKLNIEQEKRLIRLQKRKKKIKNISFITGSLLLTVLCVVVAIIIIKLNNRYDEAVALMNENEFQKAIEVFDELGNYRNSQKQIYVIQNEKIPEKKYEDAIVLLNVGKYEEAQTIFSELGGFMDSSDKAKEIKCEIDYNKAFAFERSGEYGKAAIEFGKLSDYKDSKEKSYLLWEKVARRDAIATGYRHTVGLISDGNVLATGDNEKGQCDVADWKDIIAVSAGFWHTVGLKSDGTVIATGDNSKGQCNVADWSDIVAISCNGYCTIALKKNGTVVATGDNSEGQCNVSNWKDIIAIASSDSFTIGLKIDKNVVACGRRAFTGVTNNWIVDKIFADENFIVGINNDGTFLSYSSSLIGNISNWKDIDFVSGSRFHVIGLKKDGSVVSSGENVWGACNVSDWQNVVEISTSSSHTVGLKSDGRVIATGNNSNGECNVSMWKNIRVY